MALLLFLLKYVYFVLCGAFFFVTWFDSCGSVKLRAEIFPDDPQANGTRLPSRRSYGDVAIKKTEPVEGEIRDLEKSLLIRLVKKKREWQLKTKSGEKS